MVLSGIGGDEIFGGYRIHKIAYFYYLLSKIPPIIKKVLLFFPKKTQLYKFLKSSEEPGEIFSMQLDSLSFKPKSYKVWRKNQLKIQLSASEEISHLQLKILQPSQIPSQIDM